MGWLMKEGLALLNQTNIVSTYSEPEKRVLANSPACTSPSRTTTTSSRTQQYRGARSPSPPPPPPPPPTTLHVSRPSPLPRTSSSTSGATTTGWRSILCEADLLHTAARLSQLIMIAAGIRDVKSVANGGQCVPATNHP
eukprot:1176636-Prorocentrum_minimum.AAC.2